MHIDIMRIMPLPIPLIMPVCMSAVESNEITASAPMTAKMPIIVFAVVDEVAFMITTLAV